MPIRAITFDCAQTLIEVNWRPSHFVVEIAESFGVRSEADAAVRYEEMYRARLPEFLAINLRRDPVAGHEFYDSLNREWLGSLGANQDFAPKITEEAERRAFGPDSAVFKVYEEVVGTLDVLITKGYILGVISNWDYSLHRVIEMFGLTSRMSVVVASLEEGIEKPDPRLFDIALRRMACSPDEVIHVGDDPLDDIEGARRAGIRSILISRTKTSAPPSQISDLSELPEIVTCL